MNRWRMIPRFSVDYSVADLFAALSMLFRAMPPAPTAFDSIVGHRARFWTGSGRQALWLILKALELKPGAGVALPLYCDPSVAAAIHGAGLKPVFVDVEEATLTMDPAALIRVRLDISAVVIPHFFGHVADMGRLLEVAGGIPVIEDTVHAPFSFFGGHMAGSFGIAHFYSFASSKCWPAGGGGLAVASDVGLAEKIALRAGALQPPPWAEKCRNLAAQASKALLFRRPLYGLFGTAIRSRLGGRYILEPELNVDAIQPGQAAVALRQVARLRVRLEGHRRNSLRLLSLLVGANDIVLPIERPGVRYSYHLFPVLLRDAEEKEAVVARMLSRNVDTSQLYWNLVERAHALGYQGGCPVSESVSRRMLTLPNSASLSHGDIDYVAEVFLDALQAVRSRRRSRNEPDLTGARRLGVRA